MLTTRRCTAARCWSWKSWRGRFDAAFGLPCWDEGMAAHGSLRTTCDETVDGAVGSRGTKQPTQTKVTAPWVAWLVLLVAGRDPEEPLKAHPPAKIKVVGVLHHITPYTKSSQRRGGNQPSYISLIHTWPCLYVTWIRRCMSAINLRLCSTLGDGTPPMRLRQLLSVV